MKELLRSINLLLLPFSFRLRRSLGQGPLVLATNLETKKALEKAGAWRVDLFLDCGVEGALSPPVERSSQNPLRLLWAGRLEPQKGLFIALHALALCRQQRIHLIVAGSGSEQAQMQELSRSLGVTDQVSFLGRIPHEDMKTLFQQCHAFVFTSLRDSFGSVVLEAMSNGLPIIALDHQGVGTFVPGSASIKVTVNSPQQVIGDLADAMKLAALNPRLLVPLSRAAFEFAESQTWKLRAEAMNYFYAEAIDHKRQVAGTKQRSLIRGRVSRMISFVRG